MRSKNLLRWIQNWLVVYPGIAFAIWIIILILFGEGQTLPGGGLFNLFALQLLALTLGHLFEWLRMPPLLGMISAGLILRNGLLYFVADENNNGKNNKPFLPTSLSGPLRGISIVILLTRSAFSVSPAPILKFRRLVPQLAVLPCLVEAVVGSSAVYIVIGFPIEWAALTGTILSAMSGTVVMLYVDSLTLSGNLDLEAESNSENDNANKDTIEIVTTACGLDAIIAICMAEVALGFIFASGDLLCGFEKGIVELIIGGMFGLFWGSFTGFLLNESHCIELRTFAVLAGGIMSLLGLTIVGYPRGGPLAVFTGVLITASVWRKKEIDDEDNNKIRSNFTKLWFLVRPLLFGIIGSRTSFPDVNWTVVSKGVVCLAIGLAARLVVTFAVCSSTSMKLTWRQKLFIVISWIPKGTVQAALGPVALDTATADQADSEDKRVLGQHVMNIALAATILGSSLGAVCLLVFGKTLLRKRI